MKHAVQLKSIKKMGDPKTSNVKYKNCRRCKKLNVKCKNDKHYTVEIN